MSHAETLYEYTLRGQQKTAKEVIDELQENNEDGEVLNNSFTHNKVVSDMESMIKLKNFIAQTIQPHYLVQQ